MSAAHSRRSGWWRTLACASVTLAAGGAQAAPFISEILYNPPGSSEATREWFEIHNPDATEVDLSGYVVRPVGGAMSYTLPSGSRVAAGGYFVVAATATLGGAATCNVTAATWGTTFGLNNSGSPGVELLDTLNAVVDSVTYIGGGFPASTDGRSIAVVNVANGNDSAANWHLSDCVYSTAGGSSQGTPGNADQACSGAAGPAPVCLPVPDAGPIPDSGPLTDAGPTDGAVAGDGGGGPVDAGAVDANVPAPDKPFISEIFYDAPGTSDTNLEWFEIHNPTSSSVALGGWVARIGSDVFTFPAGTMIAAQGYLLVAHTANLGGVVGCNIDGVVVCGSAFTLANSSATLELLDNGGMVVDQVAYLAAAFPDGVVGHSLAVTNVNRGNDDATNWQVAACAYGEKGYGNPPVVQPSFGSPGLPNTSCTSADAGVTLTCQVVPDAGGTSSSGGPGDGGGTSSGGPVDASHLLVGRDASGGLNGAPSVTVTSPAAATSSSLVNVEWTASDPDGDSLIVSILRAGENSGNSGEVIFTGLPETGTQSWDTAGTPAGTWRVLVQVDDGRGHVVVSEAPGRVTVGGASGQTLRVERPRGGETSTGLVDITLVTSVSDGTIGVFFDTDNSGTDGTVIAGGLRPRAGVVDLAWNTSSVAEGNYYIYAVLEGAGGTRLVAYSSGAVIVDRPGGACGCRTGSGSEGGLPLAVALLCVPVYRLVRRRKRCA